MAPPSTDPPLPTLLSQALVAFTIELDKEAEHRLAHWTNEDDDEARVHTPSLVSYPLERHGCAETAPDPDASRGRVPRLTRKGQAAQDKYRRILAETEASWRSDYGAAAIDAARAALEPLVGDGTLAASPSPRNRAAP